MKKNMGTVDRVTRIVVAAIFAILYFSGAVTGTLGLILLIFAAIFLLTSIVAFCPLYMPFGIHTCGSDKMHAAK